MTPLAVAQARQAGERKVAVTWSGLTGEYRPVLYAWDRTPYNYPDRPVTAPGIWRIVREYPTSYADDAEAFEQARMRAESEGCAFDPEVGL